MGITRSTNGKHILNDPNIFIADTGATSDSSPSLIGFKNIHKATEEDNIMDASGNSVIGEKIGDLSGMVCDKNGEEKLRVKIKNLVYTPKSGFNLFSITQRQENGWILGGDKYSICLRK